MSYENSVFCRDMTRVEMWKVWKPLFFNSLRAEMAVAGVERPFSVQPSGTER